MNENNTGVERRIRVNPWAAAVHEEIGDWLAGLGAEYRVCRVRDDQTRELVWVFDQGSRYDGRGRRQRLLIFRALAGDRDQWEIVYAEESPSLRPGVDLLFYDETNTRSDRAGLRAATKHLLDAGLAHLHRPQETMLAVDTRRFSLVCLVIAVVLGTAGAVWAGTAGQSLLMWLLICILPMLLIGAITLAIMLTFGLVTARHTDRAPG